MYNEIDLSKDGKIINFSNKEIICGITTTAFGNFHSNDPRLEERSEQLCKIIGGKKYDYIIPNHGVNIHIVPSSLGGQDIGADAIIYRLSDKRAIALVHCSWLTLLKHIISHVIKTFLSITFAEPSRIKAFIYPGICSSCYEIMDDVRGQFRDPDFNEFFWDLLDGHYLFDMAGYIQKNLEKCGLLESKIRSTKICTASMKFRNGYSFKNQEYVLYSHRARKDKERNAVFAKFLDDDRVIFSNSADCNYIILSYHP